MTREPLESAAVLSAGYDPETLTMELEFASGAIYVYEEVPPDVFTFLVRAKNKGSYVARVLTDHFPWRQVWDDEVGVSPDALEQALRQSLAGPGPSV